MYLNRKKPKKLHFVFQKMTLTCERSGLGKLHPRQFPKLQNGHLLSKQTHHTANSPTPLRSCSLPCEVSSDKPY